MLEANVTERLYVRNPRTGILDYEINPISSEELQYECKRLRQGQTVWGMMAIEERIEILLKWKDSLIESKEQLINALAADTGRLNESIREYENMIKWIDRWSELAKKLLNDKFNMPSQYVPIFSMRQEYVPYQLVGVISPWNFPMSLSTMDMIPALLAGCSVIVKPSEVTPRFIEPIQKTIDDIPELAAVLKYVIGAGDVGSQMIDHVDLIVFTGSERTGRKVAAQAGQNLIPAYLELGGKDPAIVLESADIEDAVKGILFGSICGVGHQCFSTERIYVDHKIHDQFVQLLVEKSTKIKLAYELGDGHIGPIIFDKQVEIIDDHIKDSLKKGAIIHCGGEIENKNGSLWMHPTVITNVNHEMKIMTEETFGPIMPVMEFKSIEEAIQLANDTKYGLTGSVFSQDLEEAYYVAKSIRAGGVSINDAGIIPFVITEAPGYSAFNCSGVGASRFGISGIKRFLHSQVIISKEVKEESPWWYQV